MNDADSVLHAVRPTFRAVARVVVPEAGRLDEDGWRDLERTVEHALSSRPAAVRRQLGLLLRAIEWLPVLRFGHRFSALPREPRERVLRTLESAPVLLLRRGVWGLRTLVFMGYYTRPAADEAIGYDAHLRGWTGRPDVRPRVRLADVPPAADVGALPAPEPR